MSRMFNALAAAVALLLAVGLYKSKTEADAARANVARLHAEVAAAADEIRLLKAEVAHLESPARIEALARAKLGLAPAALSQHRTLDHLERALPPPEEKGPRQ